MANTVGLRKLRKWVIFLSSVNVLLMAICLATVAQEYATMGSTISLSPLTTAGVIFSIIAFFSYIYSIKGKPIVHKFLRALLAFFLSGVLLYLGITPVVWEIDFTNETGYTAFECNDTPCYFCHSYTFFRIFVGFFILVDMVWTLKAGPLESNTSYYGKHGYADQANVIIISPDQPQGAYHQYPPSTDGTGQKIEAPHHAAILQETHAPILHDPQPYLYQQQPGLQQDLNQQQQPYTQSSQQPMTTLQHQQPMFNAPYQPAGPQTYNPQPFVPPGQQ